MKPLLAFALSLLFLVPVALPSAAQEPAAEEPAAPVSVFFVRHAETAASTKTNRDPELSDAGRERARALARLLGHGGISHLYASEYQRTQQTLAPLAAQTEVEVQVVGAAKGREQLAALRALPPGSVAVVAGHSNTVPAMVAALGRAPSRLEQGRLPHDDYDRLYLVSLPVGEGAAAQTIELGYGD